jgi:hypothetical protein
MPTASFLRQAQDRAEGLNTKPIPESHHRFAHIPKSLKDPKTMVIKVQVPFEAPGVVVDPYSHPLLKNGTLLVYNKKRDFVCQIERTDNPSAYDRISEVVRKKGQDGAKAYFAAELKSKDVLIVKVSEVLAVQPF